MSSSAFGASSASLSAPPDETLPPFVMAAEEEEGEEEVKTERGDTKLLVFAQRDSLRAESQMSFRGTGARVVFSLLLPDFGVYGNTALQLRGMVSRISGDGAPR